MEGSASRQDDGGSWPEHPELATLPMNGHLPPTCTLPLRLVVVQAQPPVS